MMLLGSTILNWESKWDLPPPPPLPAACLVLDGWRRPELQVGSDKKDEEFSDDLRKDCEVKGDG